MLPLEGNTLTALINLLRSPIQQNRTVHRLFCIATATLVLASATAVSAQSDSQRPDVPAVEPVAQQAPAAPPPQREPQRPNVPAVKPVAQQAPANPPAAPAISPATVRLQFPNSDVVDVLHLYEQLTGKKLVMDNFVQGKVNIFIAKDVSR